MIESYGISDVGSVRLDNQDRILMDHSLGLFAVADGVGGHHHGEVAAELAISTLRYYVESSQDRFDVSWPFGYVFELSIDANRLSTGIRLANRQIRQYAGHQPQYAGMGTTVAALLLSETNAVIGNVGDSRVYLFRDAQLLQLSKDDTWINSCRTIEMLEGEELATSRNVLTQAAGSQDMVDVHMVEERFRPRDLFLLTSDGLHGLVDEAAISSILNSSNDVQRNAERLLDAAKTRGAPDNVSVVLLSYDD